MKLTESYTNRTSGMSLHLAKEGSHTDVQVHDSEGDVIFRGNPQKFGSWVHELDSFYNLVQAFDKIEVPKAP